MSGVVDFVRLGYGDCQEPPLGVRALEFLTDELTTWADVQACAQVIGQYNNFEPSVLLTELEALFGEVMAVRVGRASSPLIVVELPFWTEQQIERPLCQRRVGERSRRRLALRLCDAFQRASADECLLVEDLWLGKPSVVGVRAWWD